MAVSPISFLFPACIPPNPALPALQLQRDELQVEISFPQSLKLTVFNECGRIMLIVFFATQLVFLMK